jgi:hypothetical protein
MDVFDHFLELSQLPTSFMAELALSDSSCQQHVQVESISKLSIIRAKYYLFKYSTVGFGSLDFHIYLVRLQLNVIKFYSLMGFSLNANQIHLYCFWSPDTMHFLAGLLQEEIRYFYFVEQGGLHV